jgi:chlorobactene glucosyltransferase
LVEVLAAIAAGGVLLYQGAALWLARQMPRLDPLPPSTPEEASARVSVVIAARDEDDDLPRTLDALAAQDYRNFDVVVVDGGSSAATREDLVRRAPRVRRLEEPPLPDGWVGKNWGCWVGAAATDAEWLLFLDADVRLAPSALRSLVRWADTEQAPVVTITPRVEMVGFWERVVLPFFAQLILVHFRAPHVNRRASRAAMLNGQCWLARRTAYDAVGGHAAVRGIIGEDVALARRFRGAGIPMRIANAPSLARTRMYTDRHEMFEGLVKNIHGERFSAIREIGYLAGLVGAFWLPLVLLPVGVAFENWPLAGVGAFLWVALFGKHAAFARAVGSTTGAGLLYPLAVGFYVAVIARSIRRGLAHGTVSWKGRPYAVRP